MAKRYTREEAHDVAQKAWGMAMGLNLQRSGERLALGPIRQQDAQKQLAEDFGVIESLLDQLRTATSGSAANRDRADRMEKAWQGAVTRNADLISENNRLQTQVYRLKKALGCPNASVEQAESRAKFLDTNVDDLSERLKACREERDQLDEKVRKLSSQLSGSRARAEDAENALQQADKKLLSCQDAKHQALDQLAEKNAQIARQAEEIERLRDTVSRLTKGSK